MCLDWLVTGGGLTVNPAHAVRRPKHVVKRGKILTADQARLLDGIDTSTLVGLRDRALIGVMQLGESSGQCRLIFAVVRRSRGGGCGQSRRRYARQVLGNDSRIERRDGAVRQSGPDFVHSEKRYPEVTADREPLAIRADRHLGMVYVAIARIENVAILVLQSAAPHVPDERDAKDRRILAVGKYSGAVFRDMLVVQDAGFAAACAPCSWRLNDLSMIRTLGPSRRTQAFCPAM